MTATRAWASPPARETLADTPWGVSYTIAFPITTPAPYGGLNRMTDAAVVHKVVS